MMDNLKEAYQIFSDLWKFYRQFHAGDNTDTYWSEVIAAAEDLEKKHGQHNRMAHEMLLDVLEELERSQTNCSIISITDVV